MLWASLIVMQRLHATRSRMTNDVWLLPLGKNNGTHEWQMLTGFCFVLYCSHGPPLLYALTQDCHWKGTAFKLCIGGSLMWTTPWWPETFFLAFFWVWDPNLFKRLPRAVAHLLIFFLVMLTQATSTHAPLKRAWTTRAAMNVLGHCVVLLCWHEAPVRNELPESHSKLRVSINKYWFDYFIRNGLVASLEALCALNGAQCALLCFIWPILGNFYSTFTVSGFPIEPRSTHRWLGDKLGPVTRLKLWIANLYVWGSTWNLQNERNVKSPGSRNCY